MAASRARLLSSERTTVQGAWAVGAVEGFVDGVGVGVPAFQAFDVDPAEFPLLERVFFASEEAAELFGAPDIQPEFAQDDAFVDQHFLELGDLAKKCSRCCSVQKSNTCSTTARLYQERSKSTISPAAGRCGT